MLLLARPPLVTPDLRAKASVVPPVRGLTVYEPRLRRGLRLSAPLWNPGSVLNIVHFFTNPPRSLSHFLTPHASRTTHHSRHQLHRPSHPPVRHVPKVKPSDHLP